MGKSFDGVTACGLDSFDEDESIANTTKEGRKMWLSLYLHVKLFIASYHKSYRMVDVYSKQIAKLMPLGAPTTPMPYFEYCYNFHMGLMAAEKARQGKRRQLRVIRRQIRKLKPEVLRCPSNILHKVNLLEAELLALTGKIDEATCMYEQSISHAGKAQFVNEEALANEKAGLALTGFGKTRQALPFLIRACKLYGEWGAELKVSEMVLWRRQSMH